MPDRPRVRYVTFVFGRRGATYFSETDWAVGDFKTGGEDQSRVSECLWLLPNAPGDWQT